MLSTAESLAKREIASGKRFGDQLRTWVAKSWPWLLASGAVFSAALHWRTPIEAGKVCLTGLLLCVVLLALEHTWPQQTRRTYERPEAKLILFAGILISALGILSAFLVKPASEAFFIGNILPYNDAAGYFAGSQSLLEFGRLDEWCSRRPTAVIFNAVLYAFAGQDLIAFHTLMAIVLTAALAFAASEILWAWGMAAAVCFSTIVLGYYADKAGVFMTEGPGLVIGVIAVGVLVRGFSRNSFPLSALGFYTLTLALLTRAGALFALPLIALQILLSHHQSAKITRSNALKLGVGFIIFFGLIYAAQRLIVSPNATFQGNFSYTLYGLASGGKGWEYVLQQHAAELHGLTDGQESRKIFELALAKIHADPSLLLSTLWKSFTTTLMNPLPRLYPISPGFPAHVWFLPFMFGALSLLVAKPVRKHPGFLWFGTFGVILSMPFLPDGGPRVLAATIPLVAALPAFALGKFAGIARQPAATWRPWQDRLGMAPVALLMLMLIAAPVAFRLLGTAPLPKPQAADEYLVKLDPGSGIRVIADGERPLSLRDRPISELRKQSRGMVNHSHHLQVGNYLASGLNLTESAQHAKARVLLPSLYLLFKQDPKYDRTMRLRIRGVMLDTYTLRVDSAKEL